MKMKKKLYGIFAIVLVALCALGFTFGFTACSSDEDNTVPENDNDPIMGTWQGNVEFNVEAKMVAWIPMGTATADTTIYVDEGTFAMTITNVDLGEMNSMVNGPLFVDEEYVAIQGATWKANGDGTYTAYANVTGIDLELPIVVYKGDSGYILSLTAEVYLTVQGINVKAVFNEATIGKISNGTEGMPEEKQEENAEGNVDQTCNCDEGCTCGEDCECDEACDCESCNKNEDE